MSRTRLLQPQGATRRDSRTMGGAVRRFRSKGEDAVRNGADLLG
jgi:hypothetical protein